METIEMKKGMKIEEQTSKMRVELTGIPGNSLFPYPYSLRIALKKNKAIAISVLLFIIR